MNELLKPWRGVGDFNGRATRKEYWSGVIQFTLVFFLLAALLVGLIEAFQSAAVTIIMGIALFGFVVFAAIASTALGIRRSHDFDVTGWLVLTMYIPYAGWIAMIVIGCIPGTAGNNRWGADPLGGPSLQQVFS
jgi:uncharacterized membrane protein YhaH (DUF805 family)